jgi:hypothetical protein
VLPLTGRLAATTVSAEMMGCPLASRAMPGACSICTSSSRLSEEETSLAEAPRITMAVSRLPELRSVWP